MKDMNYILKLKMGSTPRMKMRNLLYLLRLLLILQEEERHDILRRSARR